MTDYANTLVSSTNNIVTSISIISTIFIETFYLGWNAQRPGLANLSDFTIAESTIAELDQHAGRLAGDLSSEASLQAQAAKDSIGEHAGC